MLIAVNKRHKKWFLSVVRCWAVVELWPTLSVSGGWLTRFAPSSCCLCKQLGLAHGSRCFVFLNRIVHCHRWWASADLMIKHHLVNLLEPSKPYQMLSTFLFWCFSIQLFIWLICITFCTKWAVLLFLQQYYHFSNNIISYYLVSFPHVCLLR